MGKPNLAPDEYVSPYTGQVRRRAWKRFVWDRQGSHGVLGLIVGLSFALTPWVPLALIICAQVLAFARFATYELSEGWRIKDQAYVDLGGEMAGWLIGTGIAFAVLGLVFS